MKIRILTALLYSLVLLSATLNTSSISAQTVFDQAVIFNEIRLGGAEIELSDSTKVEEYITLFNISNEPILMDNWRIEYAKETFGNTYCEEASWSDFATSNVVSVTSLNGILEPLTISKPIPRQLNNTGSGSLRIVDASDPDNLIVHDLVGWGTNAPCVEGNATKAPTTNSTTNVSLLRYLDCETDILLDTNNNFVDFYTGPSIPGQLGDVYGTECEEVIEEENEEEVVEIEIPVCESVVISELLPNPNGTDKGNEFIEIFNPSTQKIRLDDCILKTSASSKLFQFKENTEILPGEYMALYDSVTGLMLANAAGGSVILMGTNDDYVVDYPANLKSNEAWAIIDNIWQKTLTPSPGAKNYKPVVLSDVDNEQEDEEFTPCPEGKYRSPETNRCRNIQAVVTELIPCKVGQIRSPETNRCRNVTSVVSSLVPCRPGQERNTETNRCRNIDKSSTALTSCQEGYERNLETNRCRKKPVVKAPGIEEKTKDDKMELNGIFLAAGSLGVIGYGAYEYRRDVNNLYSRIKNAYTRRLKK